MGEKHTQVRDFNLCQDLYDSEINARISWFWDGGFDVAIGDGMNGFKEGGTCETWAEAQEYLREEALKHYPNSLFAKRYVKTESR